MRFRLFAACAALAIGLTVAVIGVVGTASGQSQRVPDAPGKAIYKRANCVGCHKWHGNGGGGYGGDALSLRQTKLSREQIIQTVGCGRIGTGMPFHLRGAYDAVPCYKLTRGNVGAMMPPEAVSFLRPSEIEAVADYVLANIKGKGEPDFADCVAFFGDGSRVCDIYRKGTADTASGSGN